MNQEPPRNDGRPVWSRPAREQRCGGDEPGTNVGELDETETVRVDFYRRRDPVDRHRDLMVHPGAARREELAERTLPQRVPEEELSLAIERVHETGRHADVRNGD